MAGKLRLIFEIEVPNWENEFSGSDTTEGIKDKIQTALRSVHSSELPELDSLSSYYIQNVTTNQVELKFNGKIISNDNNRNSDS